jgi:hypothetical protein
VQPEFGMFNGHRFHESLLDVAHCNGTCSGAAACATDRCASTLVGYS